MIWDSNYAWSLLPRLLGGLRVTVEATLVASAIAMALGLLLALGRRSSWRLVRIPIGLMVEFVRSTPLLIQLYFVFYVLPDYGITLSPLIAGLVTLGVHSSTYTSEVYRAGIEAVPRGQWDAAWALSLPRWRTWSSVILPQAIPAVIPALGNYVIAMFKDTALLSTVTVMEMLGTAQEAGYETYRYLEPITLVGLLYLTVSYTAATGIRALERRLARP